MSLRKSAACFPLHPIRTAYPSYPDLSLFSSSNNSKDWPRYEKLSYLSFTFFHSSVTCCVVNQFFFPHSVKLTQSLSLWELQCFLYTRSGTYKKGNTFQESIQNVSEPLPKINSGRNSPAFESIAIQIQDCLEVMLQFNVVKFTVTSYMFI